MKFLLSHNKTKICTDINIIIFTDNFRNSDMFRIILIIFMGLLKISKPYIKRWIIKYFKFIHKVFVDMIKFVRSSAELVHKIWRL